MEKKLLTLFLLIWPLVSSVTDSWGVFAEGLLLLAVFLLGEIMGAGRVALILGLGYIAAVLPLGIAEGGQIGLTPWAGIFFLFLRDKGVAVQKRMLSGLLLAALVNALPGISIMMQSLKEAFIRENVAAMMAYYSEQGVLAALSKQGIPEAMFQGYLENFLPYYFGLFPGANAVLGMFTMGIAYLVYRYMRKKPNIRLPLEAWNLPWYTIWGLVAGLGLYLAADAMGEDLGVRIGGNLILVFGVISLVLGVACGIYFWKKARRSLLITGLLVMMGFFFPYVLVGGFVLAGSLDMVLNWRKLPEIK